MFRVVFGGGGVLQVIFVLKEKQVWSRKPFTIIDLV